MSTATSDTYPDVFPKHKHARGCEGSLFRKGGTVTVDRLGRIGNGGIVAHLYVCNRHWSGSGCRAAVLVTERAVRSLAVAAIGERDG